MKTTLLFALIVPLIAEAQDRSVLHGEWKGQVQYQATVGGSVDGTAHAVVGLNLVVEPDGRVRGASPENGCRLLGLGAPGGMPTLLNLDVTFSGCQYQGLNRRFTGTLAHYSNEKYTVLQLYATNIGLNKVAATYDIKATVRR